MGEDASTDDDVRQCLQDIMVGIVGRVRPELEVSPEWTKDYHQKAVAAALRFRVALIEDLLQSAVLQEQPKATTRPRPLAQLTETATEARRTPPRAS